MRAAAMAGVCRSNVEEFSRYHEKFVCSQLSTFKSFDGHFAGIIFFAYSDELVH